MWEKFEPILGYFLCCWANYLCCKWPNIEQIIKPSRHLVTLILFPPSTVKTSDGIALYQCDQNDDLLHFQQLFKACCNNQFAQISSILRQFLSRCQNLSFFVVKSFLGNFYRHLATLYWSLCSVPTYIWLHVKCKVEKYFTQ